MPGGDGSGPAGMGPMTGRAAGYCAGYSVPGYMNPYGGRGGGWGFGRGGGRGGGWGRRNMYYATGLTGWQRGAAGVPPYGAVPPAYGAAGPYGAVPPAYGAAGPYGAAPTKEQELEFLKAEAEGAENALADIRKRIEELEAEEK